jgi:DNA-binding CsgD family transcriptional regulator
MTAATNRTHRGYAVATARTSEEAVVIPLEILSALRQAVHWEFGRASEGLVAIARTPGHLDHPEWYRRQLAQFDAARGLLDALGWSNRDQPSSEVRLDARTHGTILLSGLRRALEDSEHTGRTVRHDQRRRHCRRLFSIVQELVGEEPYGSSSWAKQDRGMPRDEIASIAPHVGHHGRDYDRQVLTPRESEILAHLSRSRRYAEIAAILCIDIETVRTHARRIRHKLGVPRSRDLVGVYVPLPRESNAPSA